MPEKNYLSLKYFSIYKINQNQVNIKSNSLLSQNHIKNSNEYSFYFKIPLDRHLRAIRVVLSVPFLTDIFPSGMTACLNRMLLAEGRS